MYLLCILHKIDVFQIYFCVFIFHEGRFTGRPGLGHKNIINIKNVAMPTNVVKQMCVCTCLCEDHF